ncbi:protein SSUH2 homolog isoform X2 [Oncorhynchus tshawytscha]|uniref:Protein SSUH2 homolog n=1 Tax=Oncorhynchus tshawytscha TaxID=74940 RepID=A0AAZ3SQQ2_ONCTS|nr:protein SSUH2 homolog isoform X2 [Oncorhynchus tshawytscha]
MNEKDDEQLGAFDPNIPEEGPSAPPPGWLDCVTGYDEPKGGDTGDQLYPPPPAYNPQPENDRNASVPNVRVPQVSESVAREALLKFVGSKWSKSSKPARNLTFKELQPITMYRYRLETYTESRSSAWEMEPFTGQVVDGPQYGMSPPPWDVPVQQPQRYIDVILKVRVPHSSFVKTCHRCHGCGRTRCTHCAGRGNRRCPFCHGHGRRTTGHGRNNRAGNNRCSSCQGRGRKRCTFCHGHGHKTCPTCQGNRNLMHFIQLTITWKNHVFEFVPDRLPEFPLKKFEKVSGDAFFIDESILVYPIVGFPDQEICDASRKASQEHHSKFSPQQVPCRILQQVSYLWAYSWCPGPILILQQVSYLWAYSWCPGPIAGVLIQFSSYNR